MRYARNGDRQTASAANGSKVDSERGSPNHLQRVEGTSYNAPVKEKFNRYKFSQLSLVEEAVLQLKRLVPIPTCILPGTHDCYDAASV